MDPHPTFLKETFILVFKQLLVEIRVNVYFKRTFVNIESPKLGIFKSPLGPKGKASSKKSNSKITHPKALKIIVAIFINLFNIRNGKSKANKPYISSGCIILKLEIATKLFRAHIRRRDGVFASFCAFN